MPLRKLSSKAEEEPRVPGVISAADYADEEELAKLDVLYEQLPFLSDPSSALMRAVPCGKVAASYDTPEAVRTMSKFWQSNVGSLKDYSLSCPAQEATRFVSHTWQPPSDWEELMGKGVVFAEVKSALLAMAARDLVAKRNRAATSKSTPPSTSASMHGRATGGLDDARLAQRTNPIERWEDVTLWIDKCCVAQQHPIMVPTIARLDAFVRRCEGMVVLFTWDFFTRLWCVYEWGLFLVLHDAEHVQLCVDFFLHDRTQPRYVDAIRNFKLAGAKCFYASDMDLVTERVNAMYYSIDGFESFVKVAAITLVAVAIAKRAGLSHEPESADNELGVWADLASELGFSQLAEVLRRARPALWASQTLADDSSSSRHRSGSLPQQLGGTTGRTWRARLSTRVDAWYRRELKPLYMSVRQRVVRQTFQQEKSPTPDDSAADSAEWALPSQTAKMNDVDAVSFQKASAFYLQRVASGSLNGASPAVIRRNQSASPALSHAIEASIVRLTSRQAQERADNRWNDRHSYTSASSGRPVSDHDNQSLDDEGALARGEAQDVPGPMTRMVRRARISLNSLLFEKALPERTQPFPTAPRNSLASGNSSAHGSPPGMDLLLRRIQPHPLHADFVSRHLPRLLERDSSSLTEWSRSPSRAESKADSEGGVMSRLGPQNKRLSDPALDSAPAATPMFGDGSSGGLVGGSSSQPSSQSSSDQGDVEFPSFRVDGPRDGGEQPLFLPYVQAAADSLGSVFRDSISFHDSARNSFDRDLSTTSSRKSGLPDRQLTVSPDRHTTN